MKKTKVHSKSFETPAGARDFVTYLRRTKPEAENVELLRDGNRVIVVWTE